ncbi:MAG: nucleotidyltransferase family protein [Armatimonadota bacterium]
MIDLIRDNLNNIHELCEQHHVQRLEVFGSAADGRYREGESDLDFIVEFEPSITEGIARVYFDFLNALERLLQRPVDLLILREEYGVNPYFLREVAKSREVIHASAGEEVLA